MVTMRGAQPEGVHLAVIPRLSNNELPTVLCLSSLDKGCKGSANEQSLQESGINSLSPHENPSNESAYIHPRVLNAHNVSQSTFCFVTYMYTTSGVQLRLHAHAGICKSTCFVSDHMGPSLFWLAVILFYNHEDLFRYSLLYIKSEMCKQ